MKKILIGGATSNTGKTTFSIGLMRALCNRGLSVQPFKCGPDYIDTKFHEIATGKPSINLDTFMASADHINEIFNRYSNDADVAIIEGVMGLFDGYDKQKGSSAEIAILLNTPVVLVVNAQSTAYSVSPLIYGFKHFDSRLNLAGVVFNKVASANHYSFLLDACTDAGAESFGYMARNEKLQIPSRHLGLSISEKTKIEELIANAATEIEQHIDIEKLLSL